MVSLVNETWMLGRRAERAVYSCALLFTIVVEDAQYFECGQLVILRMHVSRLMVVSDGATDVVHISW